MPAERSACARLREYELHSNLLPRMFCFIATNTVFMLSRVMSNSDFLPVKAAKSYSVNREEKIVKSKLNRQPDLGWREKHDQDGLSRRSGLHYWVLPPCSQLVWHCFLTLIEQGTTAVHPNTTPTTSTLIFHCDITAIPVSFGHCPNKNGVFHGSV